MRTQDRRPLGRSAVRVTALSFGSAAIGGLYAPVPDEGAAGTVRRALDRGMRYLDTAPHYGAGTAERRLGAVLRDEPRESYTISTKAGRLLRPAATGQRPDDAGFPGEPPVRRVWDFSGDGIRRSLEESLDRLGLDRVDVLYLHDPDEHEEQVYAEAFPALAKLRDEGVVGAVGVGMNQAAMPARFVRRLDLDVVLCAGRYSLLDQSALAELLPACAERGTSVVAGGVYNSGLLAGGTTYDYRPAPAGLRERVARMRRVCEAHGVPLAAAALRFPLGHPAVASVLVGCRTPDEADRNAAMFERDVPTALWDDLRAAGLLDAAVPVPS
ncbi:aldo/keto reductase [Actinomadura sp. GC306]|uniref:aldo/keto reductase n=1 Tax=Actinomadura sp. GC306 TaxID=2530367 RepID=UPI00104A12F6|nr:aldo/keto reductase [Actinomadura sp. GC306]TDC69351.1 aldo/keto reductase [Actinomadura sp. GC306]